jgi:hypothetical protein
MVSLLQFTLFNFGLCSRCLFFLAIIVPSAFFSVAARRKKSVARNSRKEIAVKSVPVKNNQR